MWPWEHLAFGYVLASLTNRLGTDRRLTAADALVIGLATQLPDLIDKPLAWTVGILPSGLSLGHSLFFALPLSLLVVLVARSRGRTGLGVVFAVAYGSHLFGDALYPMLTGGSFSPRFVLWPLVPASSEAGVGFLSQLDLFVGRFLQFLGTPLGRVYLVLEAVLLVGATALWYVDGAPGLSWFLDRLPGRSR
jgi:membrane-bound metal-dependent hydrolase YbcI (DUF457 family)